MVITIKNFKKHSLRGTIMSKLSELGYKGSGGIPLESPVKDEVFPDLSIIINSKSYLKNRSIRPESSLEDIDKFLKLEKEKPKLISELAYKVILQKHGLRERTFHTLDDAITYASSIIGEHHIITVCRTELGE